MYIVARSKDYHRPIMTSRDSNKAPGAMRGVSQITVTTQSTPPMVPQRARTASSASRRGAREAGSTYEQHLNPTEMRNAWAARSHPYVRMCMNEITKRLFAGEGIVALRNEEAQSPSPAFRTYLRRDMTPFAVDALHALLAFGVVPIAFRRPKMSGLGEYQLAPYVPRFGTYTITTWADAGIQRFGFYWSSGSFSNSYAPQGSAASGPYGVYDPSVLVAHDFGYDPDVIGGHLTSNLYTISQHLRMSGELGNLALRAERVASDPPIISQYDSSVEDRAQKDFGESFFAGDPDRCQDRSDAVYERSEQRRSDLAYELERWEAMTGMSAEQEFMDASGASVANVLTPGRRRQAGFVGDPSGTAAYAGSSLPLPPQFRLGVTEQHVNHQLPRPRGDYVQVQSQIMDIVCGVLNVPRGLLASESSIRAGVEAVAEAMHRTINSYASTLGQLLTGVYSHIFGESDLRDELRIRVERRRAAGVQGPQLLTERDLFEVERKTRVRIAFDLPPTTTVDNLEALHNRGVISWKTYGTSILRLNGFGREQLATPVDPLSKQDRRLLLLGKKVESSQTGGDEGQKAARESKTSAKRQSDSTEDKQRAKRSKKED